MNLQKFIDSTLRNAWISEPYIKVYVRKSFRLINNSQQPCLDIGSVEVAESKRNNGVFSKFLHKFENKAKKLNRIVYVESILNPQLEKILKNKGYKYLGDFKEAPNMYKE